MRRNLLPHTFALLTSLLCVTVGAQAPAPLVPRAPAVTPVEPPEPPPTYPFHGQTPMELGETHGWAYLFPCYSVIKPETPLTINMIFENKGRSRFFLNPYFHGLSQKPGMLAVYDAKHTLIEDLIAFRGGSQRGPEWADVEGQSYVGFKIYDGVLRLPPGIYYLQLIYFRSFSSEQPPPDGADHKYILQQLSDQHELFRSNPVIVKIVGPPPKVGKGVYGGSGSAEGIMKP